MLPWLHNNFACMKHGKKDVADLSNQLKTKKKKKK